MSILSMRVLAAVLATGLGACSATPPSAAATPVATTAPAPVPDDTVPGCQHENVRWLVGQSVTAALLDKARSDAGAEYVRTLKPGQMVTLEFNASRLNVDLDANGVVRDVRCG